MADLQPARGQSVVLVELWDAPNLTLTLTLPLMMTDLQPLSGVGGASVCTRPYLDPAPNPDPMADLQPAS